MFSVEEDIYSIRVLFSKNIMVWSVMIRAKFFNMKDYRKALAEAVVRTIEIPNGARLSNAFKKLPSGLIDKTYTGIGGTSMELDCVRDSIVVVPYNNIANSKAKQLSVTQNYRVFKFTKDKLRSANKISTVSVCKESVQDYIEIAKQAGQPLKFICVNDQLSSLESCSADLGLNFKQFFLLLDEIDSMQEQSGFRSVMDETMDIYKKHPKSKRAMLTATMQEFSDPELAKEKRCKILMKDAAKAPIHIAESAAPLKEIVLRVLRILDRNEDKIVIACNHIDSALTLARTITEKNSNVSLSIMSSFTSKSVVSPYFGTLSEEGILPSTVNIITAAYFNGCDILEQYHNIIYLAAQTPSLRLSPDTVYQISGRARKGVLSNTIILNTSVGYEDYKIYSRQELLEFGSDSCAFAIGLKYMNKSKSSVSRYMLEKVHGMLVNGSKDQPGLFYKTKQGDYVISYLKVDNTIINQDTYTLFQSAEKYKDKLTARFVVFEDTCLHDETDELELADQDRQQLIQGCVDELSRIGNKIDSNESLEQVIKKYNTFGFKETSFIGDLYLEAQAQKLNLKEVKLEVEKLLALPKTISTLRLLYCELVWVPLSKDKNVIGIISREIKNAKSLNATDFKELLVVIADKLYSHRDLVAERYHKFLELIKAHPALLSSVVFLIEEKVARVLGKPTRFKKILSMNTPQEARFHLNQEIELF
jgi:hypothetical protein